jgi:hypothetical protein
MRFIIAFCATVAGLSYCIPTTFAMATECTCRDAIPADSTGTGTCTKTQNGSQSCKFDWNAGNQQQNTAILNQLDRQGIRLFDPGGPGATAIDRSASTLFRPENPQSTVQAMGVMMAAALARHASDRLPLYRAFVERYSDARFHNLFSPDGGVSSDRLSAGGRNYEVFIAFGCVQFRDNSFLLLVKTQFARERSCDAR